MVGFASFDIMKSFFLVLALSGCISKDLRALHPHDDLVTRVSVIALRGASANAPENTIAAFEKAQQLGAVATETEVQLTKDGKLLLFNNELLDQKTSLKGAVRDHTLAELEDVDLAAPLTSQPALKPAVKKHAAKKRSQKKSKAAAAKSLTHLITLDDLFERYGLTFAYHLELKTAEETLGPAVLKTVKEFGLAEDVTLISFNVEQLSRLRALDPHISLCYRIDDQKTPHILAEIDHAKTLGFNQVSIRASVVTHDHVRRAREANLSVIVYDVENDDDLTHALAARVSGIATRWPDRLMKIVQIPISR
jgi:glycerophosphoryl diester phosphodiesterase